MFALCKGSLVSAAFAGLRKASTLIVVTSVMFGFHVLLYSFKTLVFHSDASVVYFSVVVSQNTSGSETVTALFDSFNTAMAP